MTSFIHPEETVLKMEAEDERRRSITFRYTNWEGETRMRRVHDIQQPRMRSNQWHPEEQMLFDAIDTETGEARTFALKDCDFTAKPLNALTIKEQIAEAQAWLADPSPKAHPIHPEHTANLLIRLGALVDALKALEA